MIELSTLAWITIFAISATIVNSIGIYAIYKQKNWVDKTKAYFMCFASGVLISSPLIIALPNALSKNSYSGFAALTGFLFMFISNSIIKSITKQKSMAFGITALQGIGIHSFVDGVVYTVTFSVSPIIGFLSGVGLVIHEFAEGVITFSILRKSKMKAQKAGIYAFFVAALTTPIGAFLAYPFIKNLDSSLLGLALGFVAGVLIYVSASHLLPEAREEEKKHSVMALLLGVALSVLMLFINSA